MTSTLTPPATDTAASITTPVLVIAGRLDRIVINEKFEELRRETLLARKVAPGHYRFDIRLQGDGETVFMDI